MLTFEQQQKILAPILRRQSNRTCADCGSPSPTWASLDFGVFLCSNCSGAHRALGPTITRVKSTKLDKWNSDWVQNMKLGNQEINKYWEGDNMSASLKKAKIGSSLQQYKRYVEEKYLRGKFIIDKTVSDPLTQFKNGTWEQNKIQQSTKQRIKQKRQGQNLSNNLSNEKNLDLLDFDLQIKDKFQSKSTQDRTSSIQEDGQNQQFGDFISGNQNIPTETNKTKQINFQDLIKLPNPSDNKKKPQNNLKQQNNLMQFQQMPYNQTQPQQYYGTHYVRNNYVNNNIVGYNQQYQPHYQHTQYQQPQYQRPQYQQQQCQFNNPEIQNFTLK